LRHKIHMRFRSASICWKSAYIAYCLKSVLWLRTWNIGTITHLRAWLYWANIDRSTVRRTTRRSHLANACECDKKEQFWRCVEREDQKSVTPCYRRGGPLHGVGSTFGRRPEISYPARDCVRWGERCAVRGRNRTGARLLADS